MTTMTVVDGRGASLRKLQREGLFVLCVVLCAVIVTALSGTFDPVFGRTDSAPSFEKDIKPIEARDEAEVARYDIARKELCAVIETFPDEAERAELRAQVHRISEPRKDLARKRGKYDSRDVHQSSTQRTNKSL